MASPRSSTHSPSSSCELSSVSLVKPSPARTEREKPEEPWRSVWEKWEQRRKNEGQDPTYFFPWRRTIKRREFTASLNVQGRGLAGRMERSIIKKCCHASSYPAKLIQKQQPTSLRRVIRYFWVPMLKRFLQPCTPAPPCPNSTHFQYGTGVLLAGGLERCLAWGRVPVGVPSSGGKTSPLPE